MEFVYPILIQMYGKEIRLRCKLHTGSSSEVYLRVKEYGLKREHIQIIYEYGALRRVELAQTWFAQRQFSENQDANRRGEKNRDERR